MAKLENGNKERGEYQMFERLLSSIGIGSAKVNTVLLGEKIERGKEIKGEVHIYGGKAEQKISEIYIHIDSEFHKDDNETTDFRDVKEPILEIKITDPVVVQPNEEKVIPVSFFMPYYMPATFGNQQVTIETEIDINFVNHPVETHKFLVFDPMIDDILTYLNKRGFNHTSKSGFCRHRKFGDENPTHFLQTFVLVNSKGTKINFVGNEKDIHLYVNEDEYVQYFSMKRDDDVSKQLSALDAIIS
jgi:sporulation-control protein